MHRDDLRFEVRELIVSPIVNILSKSRFFRRMLTDFGDLVGYINWCEKFFPAASFLGTRKKLFRHIFKMYDSDISLVIELGVARGALTKWALKEFATQRMMWFGFDTFTGLPSDWIRNGEVYLKGGTFSTKGIAPMIQDERLKFLIGDVTTTCSQIPEIMNSQNTGRSVVIFDLDLFQPSQVVWKEIARFLKAGDLLYFDQAFDVEGDRRLIENFVMKEKNLKMLGRSVIGCIFEIQ